MKAGSPAPVGGKGWRIAADVILAGILLLYLYSLHQGWLFVGHGDRAARLLIALEYGKSPERMALLQSWLAYWPPVPFIVHGVVIQFLSSVVSPGQLLLAVQATSVALTLAGARFLGRTVSIQAGEPHGAIATIACFGAHSLFSLAHTPSAEVFAFFFAAAGVYCAVREAPLWALACFALASFSRHEAVVVGLTVALWLWIVHKRRDGVWLGGGLISLLTARIVLAWLSVDDSKFYEFASAYMGRPSLRSQAEALVATGQYLSETHARLVTLAACLGGATVAASYTSGAALAAQRLGRAPLSVKAYLLWLLPGLASTAVLVQQTLAGNIAPQWRYFYAANAFLLVAASLFLSRRVERRLCAPTRTRGLRVSRLLIGPLAAVVIAFLCWSAIAHATGRWQPWKPSPEFLETLEYLRRNGGPDGGVVYDFLGWQETSLAAYLAFEDLRLDNQFVRGAVAFEGDRGAVRGLGPRELATAGLHRYLRRRQPRFLVIASDAYYVQELARQDSWPLEDVRRIRGYLTKTTEGYDFRSPYYRPDETQAYLVSHANRKFVVLRRREAAVAF